MDSNIIAQAKAFFESASTAAEALVFARFGEFDLFKEKHCSAYDAALFPLLAEYFGDMTIEEVLHLVG
ncbi:hypothetical protein [Paraburkholderia caledonica]|uniref:hypothetical protein n=1 Tax=Paraburkholderia caledonica TaxID=134536 RepID=UPI000368EDAE|nr:hypothetical protein [Paraburkholderia caledonica]